MENKDLQYFKDGFLKIDLNQTDREWNDFVAHTSPMFVSDCLDIICDRYASHVAEQSCLKVKLTESELHGLKNIRNYFGEHDRTPFEHAAYSILDGIITRQSALNAPLATESK